MTQSRGGREGKGGREEGDAASRCIRVRVCSGRGDITASFRRYANSQDRTRYKRTEEGVGGSNTDLNRNDS